MASGVRVADDVPTVYNEIKLGHKFEYVIFKINDALDTIVVDECAAPGTSYSTFLSKLPKDNGRYAVFDFKYELEDGGQRNKLVFIVWVPDAAKVKQKMIYASSKDALRKALVGIQLEVQATDSEEIDHATILATLQKSK
eukprot:m.219952 g.219952  ORF g.219952 m.219952 type:complete len:140 (-) comp10279_c0_seq1:73-492(-)